MLFFMILSVLFGVGLILAFLHSDSAVVPTLCIFGLLFSLFCSCLAHYNNVAKGKVEALNAANIECVSEEHLYEMPQKDIDKLYKITTLRYTYYFDLEKKD